MILTLMVKSTQTWVCVYIYIYISHTDVYMYIDIRMVSIPGIVRMMFAKYFVFQYLPLG